MRNRNKYMKRLRKEGMKLLATTLILGQIVPIDVISYAAENEFDKDETKIEESMEDATSSTPVDLEGYTEGEEEKTEEKENEETIEEITEPPMVESNGDDKKQETTEQMTEEVEKQETTEQMTEENEKQETAEQITEEDEKQETVKETITESATEELTMEESKEINSVYEEELQYDSYEACEKETEEVLWEEKVLNQAVNGVLITVSGRLPMDAILQVDVAPIEQTVKQGIVEISDMVNAINDFQEMELVYSYDISILYNEKEYEPYVNGENLEVRFTHINRNTRLDLNEIEVFHISNTNGLEEIEVTEVSDYEVIINADEFSQYILIGQVNYQQQTHWELDYKESIQDFIAPTKGVYKVDLYGAQGGNYGSYEGGLGGKVTVSIELEKGQNISVVTGGQDRFQGGYQGVVSNGGGATKLWVNEEVIAIAGGGGGAGISCSGGNGGEHTHINEIQLTSENIGQTAGGGEGYKPGANGYIKYHEHQGDEQQGGGCYTQTSYIYHTHEGGNCEYKTIQCGATDYWGLGWWPQVVGEDDAEHVMCRKCGAEYWGPRNGGAPFDRSQKCRKIIKEEWSCGKTENSIDRVEFALGCNKDNTHVESEVMSLGGSSFYQPQICKNVVTAIGANYGNGRATIELEEIDAATIYYYENPTTLLETISVERGTVADYPVSVTPQKLEDNRYSYVFAGWDDMATQEVEVLQAQETIKNAVLQDRSYLAVYHEIPRSYAITFENENADEIGTRQEVAEYGVSLPKISIPRKNKYIFAGYYTGKKGTGTRIYREDGVSDSVSKFEQDVTLYANWIDPLEIVQHPMDVTVQAGYRFAVMETEAISTQMSGYGLSYQWYICEKAGEKNAKLIEGAVGKRMQIPTGFLVGTYDVYCEITATSAYNGQTVTKKTQTAQLNIEKGVLLPSQIGIKTEKVTYDGKEHLVELAMNMQSDVDIYYSMEPMTKDNYRMQGTTSPFSYSEAGTYPVYVYLTGSDYQDWAGQVTMVIEKATPTIYLANRNVAYNKKQQGIEKAKVYGVEQKLINLLVEYTYYTDEACTKLTSRENGAVQLGGMPSKIGTYYVQAAVAETKNYRAITSRQPAMLNIIAAQSNVNIAGYHGIYDGKPHGLQIEVEDEDATTLWFSDKVELSKENYQTVGTKEKYSYTKPGKYTVYYMAVTKITGWICDYTMGSAEIVIERKALSNESGENEEDDKIQTGEKIPSQNQTEVKKPLDKKPTKNQAAKENVAEEIVMVRNKDVKKLETTQKEEERENTLISVMDSVDELTPQEIQILKEYLGELYPKTQKEETIKVDMEEKEKELSIIDFAVGIILGMFLMFAIYPRIHVLLMSRYAIKGICADKAKNMQLFLENSKGVQKIEKNATGFFSITKLQKGETYLLKGTIKNGKTMVLMRVQPQEWNVTYEVAEIAGLQIAVKEKRGGLKVRIQ